MPLRVLLTRPPHRYPRGALQPRLSFPLGLLQLAGSLEREGFDVEILDGELDPHQPVRALPDGSLSFGLDWSALRERIRERAPALVGIGCPSFSQREQARRLARLVREVAPRAVIVGGGPAATISPGSFLGPDDAFDAVGLGEGERTIVALAREAAAGGDWRAVAGLAWRDGPDLRLGPGRPLVEDLDELAFPAFHLLDVESYFELGKRGFGSWWMPLHEGRERTLPVLTSRGCPYRCTFCFVPALNQNRWRAHSAGYVLRLVRRLQQDLRVRHLHFHDDCISVDRRRWMELLAGLASLEPRLSWDLPGNVRIDQLDEEVLAAMRRAGCAYVVLPVESGSPRVLNQVIRKRLDPAHASRAARLCRKAGLDAKSFFVVGFPTESRLELLRSLGLATWLHLRFDVEPVVQFASPWPGTELERTCRERGLIPPGELGDDEMARLPQGEAESCFGLHRRSTRLLHRGHYLVTEALTALSGALFWSRHPRAAVKAWRRWRELARPGTSLGGQQGFLASLGCKRHLLSELRRDPG